MAQLCTKHIMPLELELTEAIAERFRVLLAKVKQTTRGDGDTRSNWAELAQVFSREAEADAVAIANGEIQAAVCEELSFCEQDEEDENATQIQEKKKKRRKKKKKHRTSKSNGKNRKTKPNQKKSNNNQPS